MSLSIPYPCFPACWTKVRFAQHASTVLLSLSLLFSAQANAQANTQEIFQVRQHTQQQTVTIGGSVVSGQEVTLSAQIPGRVAHIAGEEGNRFRQGDLLVQLDERQLYAQLQEAQAALASAQAAEHNARVQYNREWTNPQSERATSMPGMGMPGMFDQMFSREMSDAMGMENQDVQRQADLYQQGAQLSQAQSQVSQAQARIEQINARLRDSRSIAPFDGVITSKMVEVGDTLQPGQPLVRYASYENLQIRLDVPTRLVHNLKVGQTLQARLDTSPQPFAIKVAQVFPSADEQRHTVQVKFDLDDDVPARAGMYAEVFIPDPFALAAAPVLMVPRQALSWHGSMPSVQVLNENDEPELRLLRIKSGGTASMVKVYAGLRDGDRVLLPESAQ